MVIKACREHMRSVCGDCMDSYDGKNYKVIYLICLYIYVMTFNVTYCEGSRTGGVFIVWIRKSKSAVLQFLIFNSPTNLKSISIDKIFPQIIVGDAIAYMAECIKKNRKFDYVFGDLTDVPLSEDKHDQLWEFMRTILNLGIDVLKPSGKYLTHVSY